MEVLLKNIQDYKESLRILPIHPISDYNIGDLMTYYGSKYIFQQTFGKRVEFLQMDFARAKQEFDTYISEYNWGRVDVVLVCGSPYLGTDADNIKLKLLQKAKKRFSNAKFIALGVGSSFRHNNVFYNNHSDCGERTSSEDVAIKIVNENFNNFDLVVSRDIFTNNLFDKCGVKATSYYDTAMFARNYVSTESKKFTFKSFNEKILVFTNPLKIECWAHLPEAIWNEVIAMQVDLIRFHGYKAIVVTSADKSYLDSIGIPSLFCTDLYRLFHILSEARKVISARVHLAIYAKCCGCKNVCVIPFDSRYITALNFDVKVKFPDIDISKYPTHNSDYRIEALREGKKLFKENIDGILDFNFNNYMDGNYLDTYKDLLKEVI